MQIFEVSAKNGAGMFGWIEWLKNKAAISKNRRSINVRHQTNDGGIALGQI